MKSLAVTGVTIGVLEYFQVPSRVATMTPFVNRYPTAGRVAIDAAFILGGVWLASDKANMNWAIRAVGKGVALEGFVDLVKAVVPRIS